MANTATPADDGWGVVSTTPDINVDPWSVVGQHPIAGPSGDLLTDAGRIAETVGANAAAGLESFPRLITQGVDWLGNKVGAERRRRRGAGLRPHPFNPNYPLVPDFQTAKNGRLTRGAGQSISRRRGSGDGAWMPLLLACWLRPIRTAIPAAMGRVLAGGEGASRYQTIRSLALLLAACSVALQSTGCSTPGNGSGQRSAIPPE